jgi:LysM repeat protein
MTHPHNTKAWSGWRGSLQGLALAMSLALPSAAVWAQAVGSATSDADHLVYQMKPGDTLMGLVNRFMEGPDPLKQLMSANRIANINRIPVGAKIKIPRSLL